MLNQTAPPSKKAKTLPAGPVDMLRIGPACKPERSYKCEISSPRRSKCKTAPSSVPNMSSSLYVAALESTVEVSRGAGSSSHKGASVMPLSDVSKTKTPDRCVTKSGPSFVLSNTATGVSSDQRAGSVSARELLFVSFTRPSSTSKTMSSSCL